MDKTPVSILHEIMAKNLVTPNYELIHDGGGTHINTFTYRVTCEGLTATGIGRSKKDAKHEAAKAMLEAIAAHRGYLQLPASPAQSSVRTPLPPTIPEVKRTPPDEPFINAVGALQDLCIENNLQEPKYNQINEVGPPHAKIFSIQCTVTTFKEIGIARTKKQAKQEAAKKMLDKINELTNGLHIGTNKELDERKDYSQIAKARYPALSRLPASRKINLGVKISEYHLQFKNLFDTEMQKELTEKLTSIIPQNENYISEELVEDLLNKLQDVLAIIGLDITTSVFPSITEKIVVTMRIDTSPSIVEFAVGATKAGAEMHTIIKLIKTLILLLK
ncbi:interferon-inducible double-stranded RNA-dependent protein kinase activator A-like [Bombus vosnesenskii]|uniref:Interferon-inducible double-stranded RNA-dependent protein kinase activator A-like n=1 Tax=Bombus vosnesenskii TaxID=207650 RepID=A0A6J3K9T0_9HYME|nr:interferon-inducible double-stranded RNA-dependent protein kinase activator A-like [Bombus vosnesenskii]XP_033349456.1 interferon-inducible double-stranded RNA-dependent protein kinase activator A-like [Bombus vosnesenskii]